MTSASVQRVGEGRERRYRVRWREYPGGPEQSKTFTKSREADAFRDKIASDLQAGTYVDPRRAMRPFGHYAEEWFTGQSHWRGSTYDRQRGRYDKHIAPTFANRPLSRIRPTEVRQWFASLDLADSTRIGVLNLLSSILGAAIDDQMIATNPAARIKRPSISSSPVVPLTIEQVEALADAAPVRLRAAVYLAATVGLRQGELFGITIDRIHWTRREIRIDRQLVTPDKGPARLDKPKRVKTSIRTVHPTDRAMTEISRHLEQFGEGRDGFLFVNSRGGPVRRESATTTFKKMVVTSGVPDDVATGWHALRHHCASVLIAQGVGVTGVAAELGHSPAECLRTYAHWWPNAGDQVRSAMADAWRVAASTRDARAQ